VLAAHGHDPLRLRTRCQVHVQTWAYIEWILLPCCSAYRTPSLVMADFAIRTTKWKEVTLEEALDDDWDMIPTITAFSKTQEYCRYLERNHNQLERIISRHLGIPSTDFVLLSQDHWVWGSFNICLPLDIKRTNRASRLPRQAILRLPLPFRCGEDYSPGNVEEKLRCEGRYIHLAPAKLSLSPNPSTTCYRTSGCRVGRQTLPSTWLLQTSRV
jgi:hypothetical protein